MNDKFIRMAKYIKTTFALEQMFFTNDDILNITNHEKIKENKMKQKNNVYTTWEDYLIDGTTVLKNIPNIQNQSDLISFERISSANRLAELYEEPISNNFDLEHLCQIHRYLFQDIYDWAGELRNVHMMKHTVFLQPEKIKDYVEVTLNDAKNELKEVQNKYDLSVCLANLFYCLIFAHPFREGNGRTIREFLRQLINSLNFDFGSYDIDYGKIDQTNLAMGITCAATMFITNEFYKALIDKKPQIKILQYKNTNNIL